MKIILISGINGFLGSHLAIKLSLNYKIIGLVSNAKNIYRIKNNNFEIYDSTDENIKKIFNENNIFSVIHGATIYRRTNDSITNLINTNILLPIQLFELASKYNVRIFFNTDSFFNNKTYNYSYLSEYTISKNQSLEWLKLLAINSSCKLVNMKIFHMYGEGDSLTKFIPQIISKINENISFIELTEGNQTRDFIYIDDVVNAYKIVLKSIDKLTEFQEFDVGTGQSTSIKGMVNLIKKITSCDTDLQFGKIPYRKGEIMESTANIFPLKKLGWNPSFPLEKGIKKMLKIN